MPAKAQAIHHTRAIAFNQDVRVLGQPEKKVAAELGLEVQRNASLVAVQRVEQNALSLDKWRRPPHVVAAVGFLDLDHVGAHVGEEHRAEGTRQQPGEVKDPDSAQWHASILTSPPAGEGAPDSPGGAPLGSHQLQRGQTSAPVR